MDQYTIFTDGACLGNPGPGGYGALVMRNQKTVKELGDFEKQTTNNRMEMMAVKVALESLVPGPKKVKLLTDSKYVISGLMSWRHGWRKKQWHTGSGAPVANLDLWLILDKLATEYDLDPMQNLELLHVYGHQGNPGNERADSIASDFAKGILPTLYDGPIENYPFDLNNHDTVGEGNNALPKTAKAKSSASSKAKPFGYVSFVGGLFEFHTSWSACERRVKGQAKAKFRKVFSQDEANQLQAEWQR